MPSRISYPVIVLLALAGMSPAEALPVFDAVEMSGLPYIDYASSPAGVIAPGSPVLAQYASLGIHHDGHTTTPPGPPGIDSFSGLPAFEAGSDDLLPILTLEITFPQGVTHVGAFYLMGHSNDAITLSAFDGAHNLIESVTVFPEQMPQKPGEYGFNEGFVGLITDTPLSIARFQSDTTTFAIDDLHYTPEPATLVLLLLGALVVMRKRRSAGLSG